MLVCVSRFRYSVGVGLVSRVVHAGVFGNVEAPDGFDQTERRAIRRAAQRAQEWNDAHVGENLPRRPESRDEHRVVSIGLIV